MKFEIWLKKLYLINDALEKINARIYEINAYKKKYAPTIQEILDYL